MSFASVDFVIFFAVVVLVTFIVQKCGLNRAKEWFLLLASYFFYGYWDWRFCGLLLFVTVSSYFTAKYIKKNVIYYIGVIVPLIVLGFFKYFNFFLSSLSTAIGHNIGTLKIILPVGISFFTFQALSYVIDVRRKKIKVEEDFIRLALYFSFFPQLVAGPIVRATDFLPQLRETHRRVSLDNIKHGIQLIVFGLIKKIVLADHISVFVDDVFNTPAAFKWTTIILAVVSYSIQIYFDFSGYSDIATGCAKCLGYDFNRNFNLPYISASVTEFWRRWHISLSTWLKEYLYIPLGGNRKGKFRRYLNLLITMLLGGLWHGADMTFVFWGGLNGLALCIDKLLPKKQNITKPVIQFFKVIATFCFINLTWIFFRANSFPEAWQVIKGIITLQQGVSQPFAWSFIAIALLLIGTICAVIKAKKNKSTTVDGYYPIIDLSRIPGLTILFVLIGLIICLGYTGERPFVYFQF